MYVKVTHDMNGLPENLSAVARDIQQVLLRRQMWERMEAARRRITTYPALFSGRLPKNWFKSDKQRRYVMMLVRSGRVPYRRTGEYGMRWRTVEVANGWKLETNTEYAKWVGGDQLGNSQAKIHQGRWSVAVDVVDDEMAKLPKSVQENLVFFLRQRRLTVE